jgi:hypothetical protein
MELAEGIRKVGFRRWYERQLIESHLYLVSGFLCFIMVLACIEGFSLRAPAWEILVRFLAITAGSVLCLWTFRRYLAMLSVAVHAAERSVCVKCRDFGGLELGTHAVRVHGGGREDRLAPVGVRCRKCGHEWTIG